MGIKENLKAQLNKAVKEQNGRLSLILRTLDSSLKNQEIALRKSLSEKEAADTLLKELKKRQEAFELYTKADRKDLSDKEKEEIEIIKSFLPPLLSEGELDKLVNEAIETTRAFDKKDIGKVMGYVLSRSNAPIDKGQLAAIILKKLADTPIS